MALPADLPAGEYTVRVGLYNVAGRSAVAGGGDYVVLGQTVRVEAERRAAEDQPADASLHF